MDTFQWLNKYPSLTIGYWKRNEGIKSQVLENDHFDSLGRLFAGRFHFCCQQWWDFFGGNPVKAGRKVCSGLMDGKFLGPKLEVDEWNQSQPEILLDLHGFSVFIPIYRELEDEGYISGGDRRTSSIAKERVSWWRSEVRKDWLEFTTAGCTRQVSQDL